MKMTIRRDNSYTVAWSENSIFFDGYLQAKGAQNRLTSDIKETAKNFLNQGDLQGNIREKFKTQLSSLSKSVEALENKVNEFIKLPLGQRDIKRGAKLGHAISETAAILYLIF